MKVKVAKITLPFITLLIIISSCNDKKQEPESNEVLNQRPFQSLTDSIRQFADNDGLYFRRAVLLNSNDLPVLALADFQKAWSLKKEEQYALGAATLLLESNPEQAIRFLKDALKDLPGSLLLRLSLARSLAARQQYPEALQLCDELLARQPRQVDVMKMKADLLSKSGREPEAAAMLETAYQLAPFDVELNYILALKYAETRNPKLISLCDSLIRADTAQQHAEPYYYKGIYYSNLNDKQRAIAMFDEAIRQDYTFLDSYIEKGSLLYEMKKYPEALKVFNLALTVSPDYADNYYWIGKCQQAMGQTAEARTNYERALGLDRNLKEAREALDKLGK